MVIGANLTPEEFKAAHNALCDLRAVKDQMGEILHPRITDRLCRAIEGLEEAFATAYKAEDDLFEKLRNMFDAAETANGFKSTWSIYEAGDLEASHPYLGATTLSYSERTVAIEGGRWLDLWKAADRAIRMSGDEHHIFIEGFKPRDEDPSVLVLSTGS